MNRSDLVIGRLRELGTVGLVAGLSGAYAAVLITASDSLDVMASTDGEDPGVLLGAVATVFILIALYVAAVVITNCVSTVT
ncbi:MAG: ABC transporter permease, partial [Ornithinimicrobium sp.]